MIHEMGSHSCERVGRKVATYGTNMQMTHVPTMATRGGPCWALLRKKLLLEYYIVLGTK